MVCVRVRACVCVCVYFLKTKVLQASFAGACWAHTHAWVVAHKYILLCSIQRALAHKWPQIRVCVCVTLGRIEHGTCCEMCLLFISVCERYVCR